MERYDDTTAASWVTYGAADEHDKTIVASNHSLQIARIMIAHKMLAWFGRV